jgi:hypothetical protein
MAEIAGDGEQLRGLVVLLLLGAAAVWLALRGRGR